MVLDCISHRGDIRKYPVLAYGTDKFGGSGSIRSDAIGVVIAMMRPTQKVYVYFVIPMPLWVAIGIAYGLTVIIPGVAWQAHLGGLIVGLIAGFFFRQRELQRVGSGYYRF